MQPLEVMKVWKFWLNFKNRTNNNKNWLLFSWETVHASSIKRTSTQENDKTFRYSLSWGQWTLVVVKPFLDIGCVTKYPNFEATMRRTRRRLKKSVRYSFAYSFANTTNNIFFSKSLWVSSAMKSKQWTWEQERRRHTDLLQPESTHKWALGHHFRGTSYH